MCGLFGMAGDMSHRDKDLLKMLAVFSSTRGEDSTGAASVNSSNKEIHVAKALGHPFNLFDSVTFENKVSNPFNKKLIIGHCRKATSGSINHANIHPFQFGDDFVGCHNGTLRNWHGMDFRSEYNIDSQVLLRNIKEYGAETAIPNVEGAYALTWYDGVEDRFYVLRNSERNLYYTFSKDCKRMFWASEQWMLQIACGKCGIDLYEHPDSKQKIFLFEENVLYGFRLPTNSREDISLEVETPVKGKEKADQGGNYIWNGYGFHREEEGGDDKKTVRSPFDHLDQTTDKTGVERTVQRGLLPAPPAATLKVVESKTTTEATTNSSSKLSPSQMEKLDNLKKKLTASSTLSTTPASPQTSKKSTSKQSETSTPASPQLSLDDPLPESLKEETVIGPNGDPITREEFDRASRHGCDWCGEDVDFEEAKKGGVWLWVGPANFLCQRCEEDNGESLRSSSHGCC